MLERLISSMERAVKPMVCAGLLYAAGTFFSGNANATECIMLKNGEEVRCDIIERQEGGYRVRLADGTTNVYSKSSIDSLVHEDDNQVCKEPMKQEETAPVVENKVELPVPKVEPKEPPKTKLTMPRNTYDGPMPSDLIKDPRTTSKDVLNALEQLLGCDQLPPKTDQPTDYYATAAKMARQYKMPADAILLYSRQIAEYQRFPDQDDKIADLLVDKAACLKAFAAQHFKLNHTIDIGPYAELFKTYQKEALEMLQTQKRDHRDMSRGNEDAKDTAWERLRNEEYAMRALQEQKRIGNMSETNKTVDAMTLQSMDQYIQEAKDRGVNTTGLEQWKAELVAKQKAGAAKKQ